MPKVLQINVVANWGSTGRIAEQIGLAVIKKGGDSFIAYGVLIITTLVSGVFDIVVNA